MNVMDRRRLPAVTLARLGGMVCLLALLALLTTVLVALKTGEEISPFLWGMIALTAVAGVVPTYWADERWAAIVGCVCSWGAIVPAMASIGMLFIPVVFVFLASAVMPDRMRKA